MPLDFYYTPVSAPCRAVLLTAKALNVSLNLKIVDLQRGDNLKPEFLKINPQHTVPTLTDNGFSISESRAIMIYLAEEYGKQSCLYPKDPKKRAVINQRLYFDMGTLYTSIYHYYLLALWLRVPRDAARKQKVDDAFSILNKYLESQSWVAGESMSLADFSTVASVSTAEVCGYNVSSYPNVARWLSAAKSAMPGYSEVNQPGLEALTKIIQSVNKPLTTQL
ncbi:glutathione S-transferase 1-1-like [Homalodisca vitripennis]|uniref:glutathione S-transferase 1-1-like n=1 Tax=Homalodisca vitripennis TaxID=197043 RepID=UPI001EEC134F|nr:glutathione S-transferase 1-1-like [Homalodisca vitripennis]XP_046671980.1 glutathione S-transferase 1-1-like [Homalodisca vitripennis]